MDKVLRSNDHVLLTGESRLLTSAALCLLNAGHKLTVVVDNSADFEQELSVLEQNQIKRLDYKERLNVLTVWDYFTDCELAVIISNEIHEDKLAHLNNISHFVSKNTIVAINLESKPIDTLIKGFDCHERLIVLNWTEPVHTTLFLEILESESNQEAVDAVEKLAAKYWGKDPYVVKSESIRSKLVSAMAREAIYLVDNGYASVADIDRACRNDAGYYLPFCGNCRYMDLMGAYAYGRVMKDLNPDLSKQKDISGLLETVKNEGGLGMSSNKGFYNYTDEEVKQWRETMDKFSYQIQSIIEKYPFNLEKKTFID